ncbi:MarR family transcriptional regulator [Rapidithrix thailandica]|uniref:MarR family transcriptional regulator n=1 Tax=Rapidithrix thailandica TaxID=413964 RepID=A0AAW9RSK6_9BACT
MKIEEAIKQKKFESERQKAVINLMYTNSWLSSVHTKCLKPFGISIQQFNVLRILRGQYPKPCTLSLVQERMLDKSSNATRLVEKLRLKGLVERNLCESNRRQVDILITEEGLILLKKASKVMHDVTEAMPLNDLEAIQLNKLLEKMRGL